MATTSRRSAGTQITKSGVASGNVLIDPVSGQPISVTTDNQGVKRLAVDAEITAENVIVNIRDLNATTDNVGIRDESTGNELKIYSDGSIDVNTLLNATQDNIAIADATTGDKLKVNPSGSINIKTQNSGDVAVFLCDPTNTNQKASVDNNGSQSSIIKDSLGNSVTTQANGSQRALDVGIDVAGVQIDPRQIRTLTSSDTVTVNQGTNPWTDTVTNLPTTVDTNYGTVGASTIRTASEIGNASGLADFNSGVTGTQTIRTTSNITHNGTELSYNIGVPDTNTLRTAAILSNSAGQVDYNHGSVGTQTQRVAAILSNETTKADFNAGTTGSSTLRTTSNITHNGVDLSYNSGVSDTNTLRTSSNLKKEGSDLDYNFGVASNLSLRTASVIGNPTGSADFNSGSTSAQTLRVSSNLSDGNANKVTSTSINSKQRLDVNTASEGTTGSSVPFETIQVGGSDGINLRTISTDSLGRLKLAGSSYFRPTFSLRVQAVTGNSPNLATSLVIPISPSSAGNFIAVVVASSVASTLTVTDNLSQTYLNTIVGTSGTHSNHIFYKENTASGVTSITINSTVSSGLSAIVVEYFGILTSSSLDKTSTGTVTGTTAFSSGATATTTSSTELLLGSAYGITKNNQTYTAGTGWSSVGLSNGFNAGAGQLYVEDQYVSSVGSYTATGTASGNDTIIADIATFVITNTKLTITNQPKVVKSGSGILRKIIVNTIGTSSPTVTLYDNTTNSGDIIGILTLSIVGSIEYNLNFVNGLTIVTSSSTGDFTLVYD